MAKYYWKGTAAGFTTGVTGASYSAWINATSVGLSANWAYSNGYIGDGVTGATALPGSNDSVYISDRFPTIGTTLSGTTFGANYTYVLSPCLNSSNVGITAGYVYLGPWSNQSVSGLPLIDTFGFSRVGGPTLGNAAVSETAGVTAANLVGNPLQIRTTLGIQIYDNDMGAYDLNLKPIGANTINVYRVDPTLGGVTLGNNSAFTLAEKPWKSQTAIRFEGDAKNLIVNHGVVLGNLLTQMVLSPLNTGITAQAALRIAGQIFNMESTAGIDHILIAPGIRCFDASAAGRYVIEEATRTGDTFALSAQQSEGAPDVVLKNARLAIGITSGILHHYDVVLGSLSGEIATSHKFAATSFGVTGSPHIKMRGTVFPADFLLLAGTLSVDPNSVLFQQGFVVGNGYIASQEMSAVDFGGRIRLNAYSNDTTELQGTAALRNNANGYYGIRHAGNSHIKFPLNTSVETHVDSPYMY